MLGWQHWQLRAAHCSPERRFYICPGLVREILATHIKDHCSNNDIVLVLLWSLMLHCWPFYVDAAQCWNAAGHGIVSQCDCHHENASHLLLPSYLFLTEISLTIHYCESECKNIKAALWATIDPWHAIKCSDYCLGNDPVCISISTELSLNNWEIPWDACYCWQNFTEMGMGESIELKLMRNWQKFSWLIDAWLTSNMKLKYWLWGTLPQVTIINFVSVKFQL